MVKKYELKPELLRWTCPGSYFPHDSTSDIESTKDIIGQDRAVKAITLGLEMEHDGYNIFVTGLTGTGKMTTINATVSKISVNQDNPGDWVYVYNFEDSKCPMALHLPPGDGDRLSEHMNRLIGNLKSAVPSILTGEPFQEAKNRLVERFRAAERDAAQSYENKVKKLGFSIVQIQMGPLTKPDLLPVINGKPVPITELDDLVKQKAVTEEEVDRIRSTYSTLMEEMAGVYQQIKSIQSEFQDRLARLQKNSLLPIIQEFLAELRDRFRGDKCSFYFDHVQEAILENLGLFTEERKDDPDQEAKSSRDPFLHFRVNVLVDNGKTKGRPVVLETHPSYQNLFGTIERVNEGKDRYYTDFTHIQGGALLAANGGYIIINFKDVISEPGVWVNLMRTLRHNRLNIAPTDPFSYLSPIAMKPEPIPLNVKVIMIGEKYAYNLAYSWDEDFKKIFKILAEFDRNMPCTDDNVDGFLRLMRKIIDEEQILHFSRSGVFALMEHAARDAGNRSKLSTRFDHLADIMREASFWAKKNRARKINEKHVRMAIEARKDRYSLFEDRLQEQFKREVLMVDVKGEVVGQINGLTVYDMGYHRFGLPSKMTCEVSMGQDGLLSIEREADMAGNIFNKGTLIIEGYLRSVFTRDKPLSIQATLCFEQSYGGIDGDSASIAETCVLMSAISEIPIKQEIAVTGSMNQKGLVQPIGGVNEKIEGFFKVCREKGFTGNQGVIIPMANMEDLMLNPDVLEAVRVGQFHIYAVSHVAEAVEILTGLKPGKRNARGNFPPSSFYGKVDKTLQTMAHQYKEYK